MRMGVSILLALIVAAPVRAEVMLACTFPTLPAAVMRFPQADEAGKTMEIGGRPAIPLVEGQGSGRLISATVDGYDFRFAPANSVMDVTRGGVLIASETGACVTIGGPVTQTPIEIAAPAAVLPIPAESLETASVPKTVPIEAGAWIVSEDISAFDDSRTVVLSIQSSEAIRGQFGPAAPAVMHLRCKENRTVLYLWLNDLFLSDIQGFGTVELRIDNQKAQSVRMAASTDNKALGLWDGGSSIPFIKKLLSGQTVVFRATPYNESPVEFSFDLTGLERAIAPLKEACSW